MAALGPLNRVGQGAVVAARVAVLGPNHARSTALKLIWPTFIYMGIGLAILLAALIIGQAQNKAYVSAKECGSAGADSSNCYRWLDDVTVSSVEDEPAGKNHSEKTTVTFNRSSGLPAATFEADVLPISAIHANQAVTVEVWQGQVTTIEIGNDDYSSLATRSDWPVGVIAGGLVFLYGLLIALWGLSRFDPVSGQIAGPGLRSPDHHVQRLTTDRR